MKVALMLYGQPRFADRHSVFQSHMDYIINKYDTDVFAHMWLANKIEDYGPTSTWALTHKADYKIPEDASNIIRKRYNPVRMVIDRPQFYRVNDDVNKILIKRFIDNQYFSGNNMSNIISQCVSIDRVLQLVEDYIDYGNHNTNFIKYDYFILARYDATLVNFPDLHSLDPTKFYVPNGGHFNDLVNISGQFWYYDYTYKDLGWNIKNIDKNSENIELPIPELYKHQSFFHNIPNANDILTKIDMYANVIRS